VAAVTTRGTARATAVCARMHASTTAAAAAMTMTAAMMSHYIITLENQLPILEVNLLRRSKMKIPKINRKLMNTKVIER
jgi:hypothetical protein